MKSIVCLFIFDLKKCVEIVVWLLNCFYHLVNSIKYCCQADELQCQRKLRTEIIQLEDTLAQVRKEYEMSRIELEQTLAANEQTGPINREMRNLISSLQNHNRQLKAELQRFKRKYKESQNEVSKLKLMERESPQPPNQVICHCNDIQFIADK